MAKITMRDAIRDGIAEEMREDSTVFCFGEDIGAYGGTLQVTRGLFDEFGPERIIDTPISENAITGACIGAAMMGLKPILELMFGDFWFLASDQIANNAAKMYFATNGDINVPMVVRMAFGAGSGSGMHHSHSLEASIAHVPGIKVVMPSNAYDAKGLLKAAVRDPNPVVFLEHKLLYGVRSDVPEEDYIVPIGEANIIREGKDLTFVTWGNMVPKCLQAAKQLTDEGIEAEVVDLRTIQPLDEETIIESVKKTSRLVIVHEATRTAGYAGEIAMVISEKAIGYLDAPIKRVTAPDGPVPFSKVLEDAYIPSVDEIVATAKSIL